jgi:adenylate kinase family enzyme
MRQQITYVGIIGDSITIESFNHDLPITIHNGLRCVIETIISKGYPNEFGMMDIYVKKNVNEKNMYFDTDEYNYIKKMFYNYIIKNNVDDDTKKYIIKYIKEVDKQSNYIINYRNTQRTPTTIPDERKETLNM